MNTSASPASPVSLCRLCQYYSPEGRRGGSCSQLNVEVKSHWKACSVAAPPFRSSWERLRDLMLQQQKELEIEVSEAVNHAAVNHTDPHRMLMLERPRTAPLSMTAIANNQWTG